ncbi:MAG TPA: ATPase domain-containing protein [candidate division Zixibacteria bacterium]|nr:ATPase domain-containing protein [candidate division Zixibacteria bacterium]
MPPEVDVLQRAKEQEQGYEWLEASKSYERLLSSEQAISFSVAKVWEKLAFCYCEASRQTMDQEQFRKLRQQSTDAYKKAAKFFCEETGSEAEGKSAQCNALAEYVSSWLAPTSSEKRKILEKSCAFGQKSLAAYERAGEELAYGKMCNDILVCLLERSFVACDYLEICSIGQEGTEYTNKAISALSKIDEKNELLRAYYTASLQSWYLANFGEQDETAQKEMVQRSLNYSEKALELSKEVNNPYSAAMSNWAAAFCALVFTEKAESALEHAKVMLEQGTIAKDNYLRGIASYLLAFVTDMMTLREADPDKQKKGHKKTIQYSEEAIHYLALVSQDYFIAEAYLLYAEGYSSLATHVGQEEKHAVLEKAVEIGRRGLEHANASGSPEAAFSTLHALSKALHSYSNVATGKDEKARLLEEALEKRTAFSKVVERAFPCNNWIRGVGKNYEGLIKVELASMDEHRVKKVALLKSAVSDMEDSVSHCKKWIDSRPVPSYIAAVAGYEDVFGGTLNELYLLVEDKEILTSAIVAYEDAAAQFKKVNMPSRVAECYWRIARNQNRLGDHQKAAENFVSALAEYKAAAERIPHFAAFYLDYALYMEAWSEIERARFAHEREKYADAMKHYENIANLLKPSKLWDYLSSNFLAWSLLEKAEDLSRKERSNESMEAFKQAAELFEEAKRVFEEKIGKIRDIDEKEKAIELCEASTIRKDYCLARVYVEEARILDLEGNHVESAEKYGSAASNFEKILEKTEAENLRKEIKPIAYMCRAWQKMKIADGRVLPELYHQASELFLEAREHGTKDKATLLASGNGAVCKALEYGTKFELTHDKGDFARAKQYLGSASNYYLKAGFDNASVWTSAAETLLDAYDYMAGAETESNPETKTKAYLLAEKCLEKSAELYETAGYIGRRDEVRKTLKKVQEKREFALSLGEMLTAPGAASSTTAISAPISTVEEPVGLQKFEREFIHANLIAHQKKIAVGEDLDLEIQLANLGKTAALLTRVEDIIPEGFDIVGEPKTFRIDNGCLDLKGKRLGPLETEEFKLLLRSFVKGTFEIEPKIVYSDENGREMSYEPEPLTLNVSKAVLPGRVAIGFEDLDDMLLGGIPQNCAVILTSPSFDERDLLVRRFLETGAKNGEITFYVTIDASTIKALAVEWQTNLYLFLCNPQVDETLKKLPNLFRLKGVENLTEINIALISAFRRLDPVTAVSRRACIEIVSDALLQHHALSVRKWLATLIPEFRSRGFTTLGVMNPQMHPPEEVQAILDIFDGEINIFERETKKGSEKFLKIRKMHEQRYLERELPLNKERLRLSLSED